MAKNTLTTAFDQTKEALKHPIPVRAYKDRIFRMNTSPRKIQTCRFAICCMWQIFTRC